MHIAVIRNDAWSAKVLIDLGVPINILGEFNYTPLHYAAAYGYDDLYSTLVELGADSGALNDFGKTPEKIRAAKVDI